MLPADVPGERGVSGFLPPLGPESAGWRIRACTHLVAKSLRACGGSLECVLFIGTLSVTRSCARVSQAQFPVLLAPGRVVFQGKPRRRPTLSASDAPQAWDADASFPVHREAASRSSARPWTCPTTRPLAICGTPLTPSRRWESPTTIARPLWGPARRRSRDRLCI